MSTVPPQVERLEIAREALISRWLRSVGPAQALHTTAGLLARAFGDQVALYVVDRDQTIVYWSPGAERLLGFAAADVVGQHCLKASRCQACIQGCGVAAHGAVAGAPLVLHGADGSPVPVRKYAQAFTDAEGAFAGGIELLVPDGVEAPVRGGPRPSFSGAVRFHGMVSQDPGMHRAFEIVRNVAATEATVLVRGESGTGKELVARALHLESRRKDGPFLAVNCAAISPSLLESELFGHTRGAFTGAVKDRAGLFQQANGGTLFLDEVAELPLDLQAKLLRVLQERVVVPVGGNDPVPVDIRVVAATHTSLRDAVARGRFREDLLYRLRVVPIFLPPLRDRLGDIEILLWQFIERQNQIGPRRIDRLQPEVLTRLRAHRWPGNVRELGNVVEYAFAVGRGPAFSEADLPPDLVETARGAPPAAHLTEDDERSRLLAALESAGGHVGRAAELLGMSRPTFWRHRKRLGV